MTTTAPPPLRLTLPLRPPSSWPDGGTDDDSGRAAVEHRQGEGPLLVVGAPGTGKTSVLVEAAARRVERDGVDVRAVLLLAPTRRAAAQLREDLSVRLRRSTHEPMARTPYAYAYGLLRRARILDGGTAPRLLTAAEQDRVLADLLEGHAAGDAAGPRWPLDLPPEVRATQGFRDELRALLMRAVERGLHPRDLERLGRRTGRPAWVAAARVLREYLDVTALSSPGAFDPAGIVDAATAVLESDPVLLDAERARVAFLAVDDAHELSAASYRLLDVLTGGRAEAVFTGDPDVSVDTFRGAQPHALAALPERYRGASGEPARVLVLGTAHRQGPALRAVTRRVADGVGTAGLVRQRAAVASARPDTAGPVAPVEVALLAGAAQEAAFVAHRLREARLHHGLDWSRMAVILRSARDTSTLRRALAAHGIPLGAGPTTLALRDEPAVVPLRLALRCAVPGDEPTAETAVALLTGVIGGADGIGLRALRRAALAGRAPGTDPDEVLARAVRQGVARLAGPRDESATDSMEEVGEGSAEDFAALCDGPAGAPLRRVVTVVGAGRAAVARPQADAHTVLWALWQATGLAAVWREQSLAGGMRGSRADRDLDAVTTLFTTAARFVERMPHAGAAAFLEELEAQGVPADTLAERARLGGAVTVTTPHGAAGREWDFVVVAGVQEGTWPDLRPRSSLLGAEDLADLLDGRTGVADVSRSADRETPVPRDLLRARRRTAAVEELRLFHVAVSRARSRLLVTAVRSEDTAPSPFLELVRDGGDASDEVATPTTVPRPLTLPALVAQLRSVVTDPAAAPGRRSDAARGLARLAAAGVPGADPDDWYGLAGASTTEPLRDPDRPVRVSPSKVESYQRCPLRWLLEQSGGTRPPSVSQALGTLVHAIAESVPDGRPEDLRRLLDERWPELGLPDGWPTHALRRRAERMLEKFTDYTRLTRAAGRELVATEVRVEAQVGRAVVRGTVDRLERAPDGSLVVVDLKTGSSAPTKAEIPHHAQLGVYQLAVESGGCGRPATSGGAALVQLGSKARSTPVQVQPALSSAEDPLWARELLDRTADGMAGDAFPATVNPLCRVCDLKRSCPAQTEGRRIPS